MDHHSQDEQPPDMQPARARTDSIGAGSLDHVRSPLDPSAAQTVSWRWATPQTWAKAIGQPSDARIGARRTTRGAFPIRYLSTRPARHVATLLLALLLFTPFALTTYAPHHASHL